MSVERISQSTRRRFVLGRQGLWPGRRWRGRQGVEQALRAVEAVQIDPVSIVAQSADIVLWSRVADYRPDYRDALLYGERKFFDYGGCLMIYPMEELPYWRVIMARKTGEKRLATFVAENADLVDGVREAVRRRGPVRNRDLDGEAVSHYRASKDTGVALYYLWLTGELMTARRDGIQRVYDFTENVAPARFRESATPDEADDFFARKAVAHLGLVSPRSFRNGWRGLIERPVAAAEARAKLAEMVEGGRIAAVAVEDEKGPFYVLAEDLDRLGTIQEGKIPRDWEARKTTQDEVVFLSPLDIVSARGRAGRLFGFDYIWEIYKPAQKRRYGPYTLPILYGDRLVGRMDAKLERQRAELRLNGVWIEDWFAPEERFHCALARGLENFMDFLGATRPNLDAVEPKALRRTLARSMNPAGG